MNIFMMVCGIPLLAIAICLLIVLVTMTIVDMLMEDDPKYWFITHILDKFK